MKPESYTTDLEAVLAKLQKVTKSGDGYKALCPAHDDHNPSLSINIGDTGKILFRCHAGCSYDQIIAALHLERDAAPDIAKARKLVATYDYYDEQGTLLYQKVRYDPKDFRIRRPDGDRWNWNRGNAKPVLYHLPAVIQAITDGVDIFIVEGEKDADRLQSIELVATTNIEGASKAGQATKWRPEYTDQLAGAKRVVIIPDNDEAGNARATTIAKTLIGRVDVIRVLSLPGLPPKGDVSNWLDAGHTAEELRALVEKIPPVRKKLLTVDEVLARNAAHDWLIKNLLERKQLGVIYGESQSFKSLLAIEISCAIALAMDWRGRATKGGAVLYIAGEGGGTGLTRRLRAWEIANHCKLAGAPLIFREVQTIFPMDTHDVIEEVGAFLQERGWKLELVILDTLARTMQGNENSQEDFAKYQQALDTIRDTFDCTSLFLHHTGHLEKDRPRGAYSIIGNADVLLQMEKMNDKQCKLIVRKMKDAGSSEDMVFQLAVVEIGGLDEDGNPITSVVLRYLPDQQSPRRPLSGYEQVAYNLLAKEGRMLIGDWRKAFFDAVKTANTDVSYDALKHAWRRAELALIDKHLVFESELIASTTIEGTKGTCPDNVPFVPVNIKGQKGHTPLGVSLLSPDPNLPNPPDARPDQQARVAELIAGGMTAWNAWQQVERDDDQEVTYD